MKRRPKRTIEEKFEMFETPEACVMAAAPVFRSRRWRWTHCGIPDERELMRCLSELRSLAIGEHADGPIESGRLIYYKGKYGHERVRET